MESLACSSVFERLCRRTILDFRNRAALATDQELSGVLVPSLRASYERIQNLHPMDQALLHKKTERAINCGWYRAFVCFLKAVQKLIGSRWPFCLHYQA